LFVHERMNRALLLRPLDQQLSEYWRAEEDPCAINLLQVKNGAIRVVSVNDTQHFQQFG
jgi:phosphoserine phosphatase